MSFRRSISLFLLLVLVSSGFAVSKELQRLPEHYRDWLTKEVRYIISTDEKEAFLALSTDAERDKFIERFWQIRNPDPTAPVNTYKEDFYKRLAYVNQWFGHESGTPGWMSDMGRVYLTLGEPKQRQKLLLSANQRPMEIWFYDNGNGALPPFFYVVFYQKETGSDFKLYSPYMDGPQKLVTSYQAESGRLQAWRLIDHDLGREVARITLSLIPSEPVDTESATSSLSSDVLLSTIKGLADNPWTKRMLEERRRMLEDVSHRVILSDEFLHVTTVPLRDERGLTNLHYLLRLKRPEDFAIGKDAQNRWYYSANVTVRVSTPEKKLIFTQDRTLTRFLSEDEFNDVKTKVFGYEGVLPLPPGKYNVEFILSNKLKKTAFRAERDIIIPVMPDTGMRLSEITPFTKAAAAAGDSVKPFQVANVKFTPGVFQDVSLVQGQDLMFFYQIWTKPGDPKTYADQKVTATYAYGRMGMRDTRQVVDELDKKQFSEMGTMVNGKKLSTADLAPGNYRLSVTVLDPSTNERAYGTMQFRISNSEGSPNVWDIVDPELNADTKSGAFDYQRAQCYLSQGNTAEGAAWLQAAFQTNPSNEDVRSKLVDSYFTKQEFKQVAALFQKSGVTASTDDQTILRIAESFDKLGQIGQSIQVLESAINLKPQSGPLYLSLANYYQRTGNAPKATEMENKGRALIGEKAQAGS